MIYLSQMLGKPVLDLKGENIGTIQDLAIATGEVFPRVTSVAFKGPDKTPFMISWRKFVQEFDGEAVRLKVPATDIRFSYLQSDELLLSRDLLNKQIVDTQGMKVVRVNDLKLSDSHNALRLLGAEVGLRGLLRAISPALERVVTRASRLVKAPLQENLIAWNYMDLLERDLSQVKLSVTHKRLHELHPADVADILETLTPNQRAAVFAHLDNEHAADTISELEDEFQADVIEELSERRASDLLAEMDPDDAADIIGDLEYDKAERLLRLMGVEDSSAIRGLLGFKDKTAGGIMTPEVTTVSGLMTVSDAIDRIREVNDQRENVHYLYLVDDEDRLEGVISIRDLLLHPSQALLKDIATYEDLFMADPDEDQEIVAERIAKYDLLAIPVVTEDGKLLGVVTIDDAFDVLEEEAEEDLARATGRGEHNESLNPFTWILPRRIAWLMIWLITLLGLAVGNSAYFAAITQTDALLAWSDNIVIGLTLAQYVSMVLVLPLLSIENIVLRGIETLTDLTPDERPSKPKRYGFGVGVGLITGLLYSAIMMIVLHLYNIGVLDEVGYVLSGFVTVSIVASFIVATALVNRATTRDDEGKSVSSTAISTSVMLLATALIGASIVAAVIVANSFGLMPLVG